MMDKYDSQDRGIRIIELDDAFENMGEEVNDGNHTSIKIIQGGREYVMHTYNNIKLCATRVCYDILALRASATDRKNWFWQIIPFCEADKARQRAPVRHSMWS